MDATLYAASNFWQAANYEYYIEKYSSFITLKDKCVAIDVGCGNGYVTKNIVMKHLGPCLDKMIFADISESMVQYCKEMYDDPKTEFRKFDILTETLPDDFVNRFDKVFTFYLLHWVHNKQRQVLSTVYKMLNDNGEIFFVFFGECLGYKLFKEMSSDAKYAPYMGNLDEYFFPSYMYLRDEEKEPWFRDLLEAEKFKVNLCKMEDRTFYFDSMKNLRALIKSIALFKFPADIMEDFLDDFMERMTKRCEIIESDGKKKLVFNCKLFVVSATKLYE